MPETLNIKKLHQLTGHKSSIFFVGDYIDDSRFISGAGDGWVVEWNFEDPEMGKLLAKVETQIFALKYLKGTSTVVVGNMNGGVHWVDLSQPEKTKNIAHHKKGVFAIVHYKDRVLTAGGAGLLSRWDIERKRAVESIHLSNQSLRSLAYSPSRNELAVGSSDHAVYLLDADTLSIRKRIENAHDNSVFTVKYSPNGQLLFSGGRDAILKVWDLDTFECLSEQPAHWYTINDLAFSPNGQWLATASRDKTIKIWDAQTFKLLKVLDTARDGGHVNSVNAIFWSNFNDTLVSCSDDRSIILWEVGF
jgi:WD40 repeat protein